ncbi:hypothetical protein BaRGS_00012019, partial [Batillaria attramentaria]
MRKLERRGVTAAVSSSTVLCSWRVPRDSYSSEAGGDVRIRAVGGGWGLEVMRAYDKCRDDVVERLIARMLMVMLTMKQE